MTTLRTTGVAAIALVALTLSLTSCGGNRPLSEMDASQLFALGKQKYDKKKYVSAVDYLQTVVFNYPGNAVVDTAQYYLALSYFGNKEYELAAVEFNRLAVNYPSSPYFENAVFMRAASYFEATPHHYGLDQTDLERAIDLLNDFLIDFPESDLVPDAKRYLAEGRNRLAHKTYQAAIVYERLGAPKAARIYFQKVIDDYTDTDYGPLATYHYALMDLRLKEYDDARRRFENFATVFPDNKLAGKALAKAAQAAFKNCEATYKSGQYATARQCLIDFKQEFPNNGHVGKADELLKKIDQLPPAPPAEEQTEHAGT